MSTKPKIVVTSAAGHTGRETVRISEHRNITPRGAGHFIQEVAPEAICNAIEVWQIVLEVERPVSPSPFSHHAERAVT